MLKKLPLLLFPLLLWTMDYSVSFLGLEDTEALQTVQSASVLYSLKKTTPISLNALRFRAESDIPDILKAMHVHGYYEASATVQIESQEVLTKVVVQLFPGPKYRIGTLLIEVHEEGKPLNCSQYNPNRLPIHANDPVHAVSIIDAELQSVALLGECGYPLATVETREMIADYLTKTLHLHWVLNAGKRLQFGPTSVMGAPGIKRRFFEDKNMMKLGTWYDSRRIQETEKKLLRSGLFSSIMITYDSSGISNHQIPIHIEAIETQHKSIRLGASYQTFFGPGLAFGWENRNVSGLGRKISLQGECTTHTHNGKATWFVPDFGTLGQDYISEIQTLQESILPYHRRSYICTHRIERRCDAAYRLSLGMVLERMWVHHAVENGRYSLIELPLSVRWSSADELLNPTTGSTLEYQAIPSFLSGNVGNSYLHQTFIYSNYATPFTKKPSCILAHQFRIDSMISKSLDAVPVPKRIFGGSDTELRGYKYHTVSEVLENLPVGGRSALFYTFEIRLRIHPSIGIVPFVDIGSISSSQFPTYRQKWYRSVGMGVRYFTLLGPIRCDLGFPLDRRNFDTRYRFLVSIGQSF